MPAPPAPKVVLRGDPGDFQAALHTETPSPGIELTRLVLTADAAAPPPPLELFFTHPSVDIQATWHPAAGFNRGVRMDWSPPFVSKATSNAPVVCLHNLRGENRLTFACSEVREPLQIRCGVHEETGEFFCAVAFFQETKTPLARYEATLRIDTRAVAYHAALDEVTRWWAAMPGAAPASVPESAKLPMLSTWYSFHQSFTAESLERECRAAKALGCEAVIVDDGWQTLDSSRGYAFCGDWAPERVPEMAAHVARVHALGMKYILWYSVPFIGEESAAFARFEGKYLGHVARLKAWVLDPRYPEVRRHLIQTYERALREWDLDGLKLDFVDRFTAGPDAPADAGEGRDFASVDEAVDRLLSDVMTALRAIKPEVMIEFRQSYIGPLMRKCGNMFRVNDCPNDGLRNRIGTLDLRLLCGGSAVHADMLMWHPDDPVESAALQLLNVIFAVPQISVLLDRLPDDHMEMVRFWLGFWRAHRGVLLGGKLTPLHPETLFPAVIASTAAERVAAFYDDAVVDVGDEVPRDLFLINATRGGRVVLEAGADAGGRRMRVFNCRGDLLSDERLELRTGLHRIAIPPAGLAHLEKE